MLNFDWKPPSRVYLRKNFDVKLHKVVKALSRDLELYFGSIKQLIWNYVEYLRLDFYCSVFSRECLLIFKLLERR